MDYTSQKLIFKLKKAIRYIRLYGVRRTLIKIKGQYHMKKHFSSFPEVPAPPPQGGHVGLIGCGNYAFSNIAYYLHKNYGPVIRASMDIDLHKAASLSKQYGLRYYTDDAQKLIDDSEIDLVYIASNHASHADYAIQALQAGKSVHIEKPHVVHSDQLERLCAVAASCPGKVNLGFNRPVSRMGKTIKRYLLQQHGSAMFNFNVVGHDIPPDHWYANEEEGGRVFGNLCHWSDFILQLVAPADRYPLTITPTRGKKSDCDIALTYTFGDETIAAITFSAKGDTFEGVRERFTAQKGDVLIALDDFKTLIVEVIDKKFKISTLFRDHGHEANIIRSYELVLPKLGGLPDSCSPEYLWETGNLFLKTRDALETNQKIVIPGCPEFSPQSL